MILKRLFDLGFSLCMLLLLAPLLVGVALWIKLDSRGPVLFRQQRVGRQGLLFDILKFRTMRTATEQGGPQITVGDDVRITRAGRFLRRHKLDELPQFLNVLRGEMSLVGPRPHAIVHDDEYKKLISKYAYRLHLKPGITGLAQVNGFRGETATIDLMERRVDFDLWYINNWSLWLDIKILLKTFAVVIGQKEAY